MSASRYDRDLTDIYAVQDELKQEIVAALKLNLTRGDQDRLTRARAVNVQAYEFFLAWAGAGIRTYPFRKCRSAQLGHRRRRYRSTIRCSPGTHFFHPCRPPRQAPTNDRSRAHATRLSELRGHPHSGVDVGNGRYTLIKSTRVLQDRETFKRQAHSDRRRKSPHLQRLLMRRLAVVLTLEFTQQKTGDRIERK
ncbi:hypothetical protein EV128_105133 [Rhizobium azibense]|nr:hypothetical protein EV128_105133 [Rhizobium azibense]